MVQFKDVTSSVIIYGFSEAEFTQHVEQFSQTGIQFVFASNFIDFKTKVSNATHLISLLVQWDSFCAEESVYFRPYRSQLIILGREESENDSLHGAFFCQAGECVVDSLKEFQKRQFHPDLGKWMVKCASFLLPFHLTSGTITFSEKEFATLPDYRFYRMNLELEPFVGVMLMGVDFDKFQNEVSSQLGLDQFLCEDFLLELLNQFAGVLTRPFFNHFHQPKVMMPHRFHGDIQEQLFAKTCLPLSSISDQEDLFQFSLAILHTERGGPFKASMDAAWDPIQSLEFL